MPCIPLPIINADDNFGYSLGIKLTKECKDMIKEFNPTLFHFTVPDFLALDALRWAKQEVRSIVIHEAPCLDSPCRLPSPCHPTRLLPPLTCAFLHSLACWVEQKIPVIGTWHSNYSDYLKFYHLNLIRTPVDKYIRSFYVNMPIYVPVSTHRSTALSCTHRSRDSS